MLFIGSGALLFHAVDHCLKDGLRVDAVCCPPADSAARRLRDRGIPVLESADPNADVPDLLGRVHDGVIFSINNPYLLDDALLDTGGAFFNVHNGLVQRHRGIAEVCIFAALCRGEEHYGVTLHRLLARQRVDTGPVVAQSQFDLDPHDAFSDVLRKSLEACQMIFASNVRAILAGSYTTRIVNTAECALTYKDIPMLYDSAEPARRERASSLGRYAGLLPRLKNQIDSARAAI